MATTSPQRRANRQRAKARNAYVQRKVRECESLAPTERARYEELWRIEWEFDHPRDPVHNPDLSPLTSPLLRENDDA